MVTRSAEGIEEAGYVFVDESDFAARARQGRVVLPFRFGEAWYGYDREQWEEIRESGGMGWIFNVRPYAGLALATTLPRLVLVWLEVPESTRQHRLQERRAGRDKQSSRLTQDGLDLAYRDLYPHVVQNEDLEDCTGQILSILTA